MMNSSDSESGSASPQPRRQSTSSDILSVGQPTSSSTTTNNKKRSLAEADNSGSKVTKRRAARACVSCRARKVRCDVVEGAPCGNCRWDNVECVVQESRRRRKHLFAASSSTPAGRVLPATGAEAPIRAKAPTNTNALNGGGIADAQRPSIDGSVISMDTCPGSALENYIPHLIYQPTGYASDLTPAALDDAAADEETSRLMLLDSMLSQASMQLGHPDCILPAYIKPLPTRTAPEDVRYLHAKGALTLPSEMLQNALVRAYVESVHPYMPLMELHDFLSIVNSKDGRCGQVSLLLYQAVMFSASSFVDNKFLREAGYSSRKAARRAFFQRTRLLYDFDYESDRLVLVQSLLLMTYWYETPDDQKDTWHWMGVAISLAHTIGLHRDPANTNMPQRKQMLWKRIWWSCFMRDRLIALGMRRPTRIKDEDFDVPMLSEHDFEIESLSNEITLLPPECAVIRDISKQMVLADLCVQKARLCVLIGHMLRAQYSVLIRDRARPDNTTNSTMMLFPNKRLENLDGVNTVDMELRDWYRRLPPSCQYRPLSPMDIKNGDSTIAVHRNLLHMVYYTTISALHRPQFLPSSPQQVPTTSRQVQEVSRMRVRDSADHITRMVAELHQLRLERYLPTTGVTVILPAMIIHLLEMKNQNQESREKAARGFQQCMRVMEKLREIYSAADFATGFLDAALRKASIDLSRIGVVGAGTHASLVQHSRTFSSLQFGNTAQVKVNKPSTPPPETVINLGANTVEPSLFSMPMNPGGKSGPTVMISLGQSPPATDPERDADSATGQTPSSSSMETEDAPMSTQAEYLDIDFNGNQDEFDWNAMTGTNLDFDQWLQFPGESGAAGLSGTGNGALVEDASMEMVPSVGDGSGDIAMLSVA